MRRELSACVIQKSNGYELLRNYLNSKERKNFIPIDTVYESTLNEKKPIECFYASKIYLGYHTMWKNLKMEKKFSIILVLDNAIIAITILLGVQKRWKNICPSVQAKLDLLFHLTMVKSLTIKITAKIWVIFLSRCITISRQLLEVLSFSMRKCMWLATA